MRTIHVLPSNLVATVAELIKVSPDCAIQAHAGNGVICVEREARDEGRGRGTADRPIETRVFSRCARAARGRRHGWLRQSQNAGNAGQSKERFDPANILNPGVLFD